jgi:hypothetical protein
MKQETLPGVEGGIPELEQLGYEFAMVRDKRKALLKQEGDLKNKVLEAMHRNHMLTYNYEGLSMEIIPGKEGLLVEVNKDGEGAGEKPDD